MKLNGEMKENHGSLSSSDCRYENAPLVSIPAELRHEWREGAGHSVEGGFQVKKRQQSGGKLHIFDRKYMLRLV